MSDCVNMFDWGLDLEEDVEMTDWTALKEEVMSGEFATLWEEEGAEAAVLQPGDSKRYTFQPVPMDTRNSDPISFDHSKIAHVTDYSATSKTNKEFMCQAEGCHHQFKRRSDLNRHSQKHGTERKFSCTAVDCPRSGSNGFARKDKLNDHILAGHDDDTLFTCSACQASLTRDLMALHNWRMSRNDYRTCPMPRCSFKVHLGFTDKEIITKSAKLQVHLLEKHEVKGRAYYANLLARSGYDFQTGNLICPACPSQATFSNVLEFKEHLYQTHFHGPACAGQGDASFDDSCYGRDPHWRLRGCTQIPNEIREHRRTILRIWPGFWKYPLWEDIKCPENRTR